MIRLFFCLSTAVFLVACDQDRSAPIDQAAPTAQSGNAEIVISGDAQVGVIRKF